LNASLESEVAGARPQNVINGILWRLRTGAPWRDVPEKYVKWNSIYRRFRRWSACGVLESVAIALAETMAESGHYDIDSTRVRAHVSAAGGKGGFDQRDRHVHIHSGAQGVVGIINSGKDGKVGAEGEK
jgi:transposase